MGQETTRLDGGVDERPTRAATPDLATDDPDEIEREIEHTRAELSETIDEIQERLNPEALKQQAKTMAHDATIGKVVDAKDQAVEKVQEFAGQAVDKVRGITGGGDSTPSGPYRPTPRDGGNPLLETVRANPIPAAIAGAGLGWFLSRRTGDNDGYRSSYMSNNPAYRSGYRGQTMDYRTGYTDWDRQQPEPGHLRDYEDDGMVSQLTGAGGSVVGMIQRNPLPAALAGLGVGWFLMRRQGSSGHGEQPYYYRPSRQTTFSGGYRGAGGYGGYGQSASYQGGYGGQGYPAYQGQGYQTQGYQGDESDQQSGESGGRIGEMTGQVQERAGEMTHRAQEMGGQAFEQVSHYGHEAMEHVSHLPREAQDQFQHLRGAYEQRMQDNPLLMGAVALGLGLAVGMMIPETRREQRMLGEQRDELFERAQEMAGEAVDRVQHVAEEAFHAAEETAKDEVQKQGKQMQSSMSGSGQSGQSSQSNQTTGSSTTSS